MESDVSADQVEAHRVVGRRTKRIDGMEVVTGRAVFADDVRLPGMVHARLLHAPHARPREDPADRCFTGPFLPRCDRCGFRVGLPRDPALRGR
jgi:hypothetical protein